MSEDTDDDDDDRQNLELPTDRQFKSKPNWYTNFIYIRLLVLR